MRAVERDPLEQPRGGGGLLASLRRQRHEIRPQRTAVLEVGDLAMAHQVNAAARHS
jgi:hypothetical protein